MKISKFTFKKPVLNITKTDVIVFTVSFLFAGAIAFVAFYSSFSLLNASLYSVGVATIFGLLVYIANTYILSGVTYPSIRKLIELTVYTLIMTALVAIISLGLDLFFVKVKELILK